MRAKAALMVSAAGRMSARSYVHELARERAEVCQLDLALLERDMVQAQSLVLEAGAMSWLQLLAAA